LKDTLFNLADSEYSFATGNTEEFVLGKIALLEEIERMAQFDVSLEFFLPCILEDLVLGFGLGSDGKHLVIPGKLYNRRVVTTPILKDNIVGDPATGYKLVKNCFNRLTQETSEIVQEVIAEYSTNPITKRTLSRFKERLGGLANQTDSDDEEGNTNDAQSGVKAMFVSLEHAKHDDNQADNNLQAYEAMNAKLVSEMADFTKLNQKLSAALASKFANRSNKKPAQVVPQTITDSEEFGFSVTANDYILSLKLQGEGYNKLGKLDPTSALPEAKLLTKINSLIRLQKKLLEESGNLADTHQLKVHDIMDVIVRAVDLEEEVLESYLKRNKIDKRTEEDIAEFNQAFERLQKESDIIHNSSKYTVRKTNNSEFELSKAEAELEQRMTRIKSRIYMSYNKSKMIAKQIFMLRRKANTGS